MNQLNFEDDKGRFTDHFYLNILPTYDTTSKLEFNIPPAGAFVLLQNSTLQFECLIPEEFVVENQFSQKLIEFCEFKISHVTVQQKSSENDNLITSYMQQRIHLPDGQLDKLGMLEGYYSSNSPSARTLYSENGLSAEEVAKLPAVGEVRDHNPEITLRRKGASRENVVMDGVSRLCYRYQFISKLNSPYAKTKHPLPRMAPLTITFHRAPAAKSLLSLKLNAQHQNIADYPFNSIKLINPTLCLAMAHSEYYDRKYTPHKLERIFFPFSEMSIRRDTLVAGQSDFKLKLSDGPLPTQITFGLMKPDQWDGSYETCITHFKPFGLQYFDLQVFSINYLNHILSSYIKIDAKSIPGYPLQKHGKSMAQFYYKFNKECGFWNTKYANGSMDYDSYVSENFIITENLKAKKYQNGQFTLNIKFADNLSSNMLLVMMVNRQKALQFDEWYNISIHNLDNQKADAQLQKLE